MSDPAPLAIACATDDGYAPHCATMLRSLLAHHDASALIIHVLHDAGLSADARRRLHQLVEGAGATLRWLEVTPAAAADFPDDRFHISCWYRVLLPELLPQAARVLYLDSDLIVRASLRPLWGQPLDGKLFAAVVNPLYAFMPDRPTALGLDGIREYLNSGVMLMDLAAMRAEGLVGKLRAYAAAHRRNPWPEQDALSVVCRGRWLPLPPRWNAQSTLFDLDAGHLPFPPDEVRAARRDPAVVHFIGPLKPWHYLCRHPLRHEYAVHRRQTPWPDFHLEGRTLANRLLRPLSLGTQLRLRAWTNRLLPARLKGGSLAGPRIMRAFARHFPAASFVQIGSNDGDKHDPLRAAFLRTRWTGVMVEPVPYVFERLRRHYGAHGRARLENVAVATQTGTLPFWHLPLDTAGHLPDWYDELGSFRREVVLRHAYRIPDIEHRLTSTQVSCVTFDELCARNRIHALDLLHMDTEGYDYEILKSIDLDRWRPALLIYEHKHLGAERAECRARLRGAGYATFEEGQDTWCADTRGASEAQRAFLREYDALTGQRRAA